MGRAGRQEVVELRSLLARIPSRYGGKLFYFVREKPGYRTLRVAGRVTFRLIGAGKSVF